MPDVLTFDILYRTCQEGERDGTLLWEEANVLTSELEGEEGLEVEGGFDRPKLRLSAAAVWARCPLLRPVIQGHLTTQSAIPLATTPVIGVPTMSLAVAATYEALYCITRYVRSGVLLCPPVSSKQDWTVCLELIKLSHQWGMDSLLKEVM